MAQKHELYAAAHQVNNGRGLSKADLERTVVELFEDYPAEKKRLAALLSHFLPKAPSGKNLTVEQWVAKAVAVKDLRGYLSFVMSDGQVIVATDGHRLHGAPTTLPRGLYCPRTMIKLHDLQQDIEGEVPPGHPGKFPQWERILPKRVFSQTVASCEVALLPPVGKGASKYQAMHLRINDGFAAHDTHLAISYLNDVKLRCNEISASSNGSAVRMDGPAGEFAVVMPIRVEATKAAKA